MESRRLSESPILDISAAAGDKLIIEPRTHHHSIRDSFESDSDTLLSPITFAPPSSIFGNAPHHHPEQTLAPTPHSEIDSKFTTTLTTREGNSESNSAAAQSYSSYSLESSTPMPHLHVSTHTDAVSLLNPDDLNVPVAKSDWLVPLNEVVISIRRTARTKPQSWTGEWNREMKDVIRDLRRL